MVDKRAVAHAETLIRQACRLAGPFRMIDQNRSALQRRGVIRALRDHDTPVLFDWLMSIVSYQGIADRVADQYIRYHGNITWGSIKRDLKANPPCPKLAGYWAFDSCRYLKSSCTCSQPQHFQRCKKLCTSVSTTTNRHPTSRHRACFLGAAISRADRAMLMTLSEMP